jgi:hypothetical protein
MVRKDKKMDGREKGRRREGRKRKRGKQMNR